MKGITKARIELAFARIFSYLNPHPTIAVDDLQSPNIVYETRENRFFARKGCESRLIDCKFGKSVTPDILRKNSRVLMGV